MKLSFSFLAATLMASTSCLVEARVRGGASFVEGRKLQDDKESEDNASPEEGEGGLIERNACEPNAQRAVDFIDALGRGYEGSEECLVDPVNGCGGGCCRIGSAYFICDSSGDEAPILPCVCNSLTAPPPVPEATSTTPAPAPVLMDIVDTAVDAASFNTLVDLVATAGLVDTLKSPGPFTVFAPLDAAFPSGQALEEFKNATDLATLTSILTYHVVPGKIMASDLTDGAMVQTVQGNYLTVDLDNGPRINNANIVHTDIETTNGVIHVIDTILVPSMPATDAVPVGTIVDTAVNATVFNTLVDLVVTAGLTDTLSGTGPFTVFAPVDAAFPSGTELDAFKANTPLETLTSILTYHVVPGIIRASDLSDGAMVHTVQGSPVKFSIINTTALVNDATITSADIETTNGVIHVIDKILMPPPPTPAPTEAPVPPSTDIIDTAIAAGQFTVLAELLTMAGLVGTLKGPGPFTVFAPNDAAFGTPEEIAAVKALPAPTLQSILTYHVLPGMVMSSDLSNGAQVATLEGSTVSIIFDDDDGGVMVNDADILTTDILTSNGVIHIIDEVLLPPGIAEPEKL